MARHRNVRAMDPDEEYEGYYSCYGHSVEEEFCISPRTEAQFLYDRNAKKHSMSSFLVSQPETEAEYNSEDSPTHGHNSSYGNSSNFSDIDRGKMQSCVEALQDVVGDTVSEVILKKAAIDHSFELTKALDAVLSGMYSNSQEDTTFRDKKDSSFEKKEKQQDPLNKLGSDVSSLKISAASSAENKDCLLKQCAVPKELDFKNEESSSNPAENFNNIEKCSESTSENFYNTKSSAVKKDVVNLYEKDRANNKPLLNLVVIGHVDAGKSTLMGHMLYSLGFVPKKAMHKYESESKKLGKASFMYAWVLDETSEERNRGITMDVAQSKFETPNRTINLLDAPGHKDFIPNMIAGAAQADVAILVVDATRGEFETGFETGGQTREHTMLIRSLGVSQLGVAVNKMDNVNWDKQRYDSIVNKLSVFLKQVGVKENDVQFVPCSGLTGENLIKPLDASDDLKKWYEGPALINVIDSFKAPERAVSKPFRMCVSDVFKGMGSGFCVAGRIEAGCVQNGDKVLIMPAGEQAVVRGISVGESAVHHSFAGDHAILQIISVDMNILTGGSIICDPNVPVKVSSRFQARLVILNITVPITKGFPVILHYQSLTEQAVIKKLISQLHRSSGELLRKHPRCLTRNSSAVVEIEVSRPICLELYRDFKELGRFMLRSGGSTIAAGLVTEVL